VIHLGKDGFIEVGNRIALPGKIFHPVTLLLPETQRSREVARLDLLCPFLYFVNWDGDLSRGEETDTQRDEKTDHLRRNERGQYHPEDTGELQILGNMVAHVVEITCGRFVVVVPGKNPGGEKTGQQHDKENGKDNLCLQCPFDNEILEKFPFGLFRCHASLLTRYSAALTVAPGEVMPPLYDRENTSLWKFTGCANVQMVKNSSCAPGIRSMNTESTRGAAFSV